MFNRINLTKIKYSEKYYLPSDAQISAIANHIIIYFPRRMILE